jgi:amidohydrolase
MKYAYSAYQEETPMNHYLEEAMAMKDELIANRRHIHRRPELGFDLPETIEFVATQLESYGYNPVKIGGGLTCTVGSGSPVIMLRADMDALPQQEDTGLPFSSEKDGVCHSCGHDAHTTMLLGAAKLLKTHECELKGTVKFMFQPAEELLAGSRRMIEEGILENPHVDAAMGFHVNVGPLGPIDYHAGTMNHAVGRMMASADEINIKVKGRSAHGASAYLGINAVAIASNIVTALQQMPIMETKYNDDVIMCIGKIEGGSRANIIPDEATITMSFRTFTSEAREYMRKRVPELASGIASAWRAEAETEFVVGVAPVYNNEEMAAEMHEYALDVMDKVQIVPAVAGSEDFANVCEYVPTFWANIGFGDPSDGYEYSMHNPKMRIDENGLPYGVAAHCHLATEWLRNHSE